MSRMAPLSGSWWPGAGLVLLAAVASPAGSPQADPRPLLGIWRGTSTCTDRVAAPACQDEVVLYELTPAAAPGGVHWIADKIVNGQREPMGELDLTYAAAEACWKATYTGPRVTVVWRLSVDGTTMTGSAHLMPGNQQVRKVELRKDAPPADSRR
jgi:hypothetical protein